MVDQKALQALVTKNALIVALLLPLSLTVFAYERSLVPLFGSGPTNHFLNIFIAAGATLAALNPKPIAPAQNWLIIALLLTAAPNANYWVAVLAGRSGKVVQATAITHATVLLPIVAAFSLSIATPPTTGGDSGPPPRVSQRMSRAILAFLVSSGLARGFWPKFTVLNNISESKIYLGMAGVFYLACIFTTPSKQPVGPAPSKQKAKKDKRTTSTPSPRRLAIAAVFTVFWGFTYRYLENRVLPHPLPESYTSRDGSFRVLSAAQSVTGLITVVDWLPPRPGKKQEENENAMHSARYLRASHSILGGVWTHQKVMLLEPDHRPLIDSSGTPLGDSIYATFVLQEAVRLVNNTLKGKEGKLDNALVIGLGIGTSATSLMRHGVSTTIVEIDPEVYKAARKWFALPKPDDDKVFIEDARQWVEKRQDCATTGQCTRYDTVIHDCFSGGGVPEHLFTTEFWTGLKNVLEPEGVLVVNYAGIVDSESTRLVVNTLLKTFKQCRGFHDFFEDFSEERFSTEFINMVLFCTNSKKRLSFRKAIQADFLGSPLRRHVLDSLDTREVDLTRLKDNSDKYVLTDKYNPLGKLQAEQGAHHWEVMRQVLPDSHWETF
ncbi:hypothetical protein FA15DRAFT_611603 [Coprinopsis marcescibilis]|uniref:PABS domain-containing protein n=1 Tax=Coprinopsis marcescibilis TaxID=230819 RepID=A0A5C3LA34_COPMA|nr:hypothetical protein FA15DRAFT_611603 [Coprinopsis marcescibilis]